MSEHQSCFLPVAVVFMIDQTAGIPSHVPHLVFSVFIPQQLGRRNAVAGRIANLCLVAPSSLSAPAPSIVSVSARTQVLKSCRYDDELCVIQLVPASTNVKVHEQNSDH